MTEDKKIRFSGDGSELSAFMKKLQSDGRNLYESFAKEAIKLTTSQKEQSKIISDQIKLYRDSLKIQKEITEEKLKQVQAVLKGIPEGGVGGSVAFENMAERTAAQKKIDRITSELNEIKDKDKAARGADQENRGRPFTESSRGGVFNDIMKAGLVRDLLSMIRSVPNQENGSGLISPFMQFTGAATGAALGSAIDAANVKVLGTGLGDIHASTTLSNLLKEVGGFYGDAIVRSFKTQDHFTQASGRFRGLGGTMGNIPSLTAMGYSDIDFAEALGRSTGAAGNSRSASERARMQLGLSRGFGIDESVTTAAFGTERVGQRNSVSNIQRALGIAIGEGLDRAKFSDAIINQTQLIEKFSQVKENVSSNEVNRLMYEFNRMGGMFSIGDPRSMGNIAAIDAGLTNPNDRFFQSRNYAILSKLNPNANPMDLLIKQEQGSITPGFLAETLRMNRASGFSPEFQELQLASQFPQLSKAAVRKLYQMGPNAIGSMTEEELSKNLGTSRIAKEAESLTSHYTKMNAEVVNAFKQDFQAGISALAVQFEKEIGRAIEAIADKYQPDNKDDQGRQLEYHNPPASKLPLRNGYYRTKDHATGGTIDHIKPTEHRFSPH